MDEDIETICSNIKIAFEEETQDTVSLVTIIDLYGSQINENGSRQEKECYLEYLLQLLKDNKSVVQEIGWDLPKLLLEFVSLENIDLDNKLSESKVVSSLMKCFNEISLLGNAKECLLTGCELLSELIIDDTTEELEESAINKENAFVPKAMNEFIPDLKIHIIFQLLITTMIRIETIAPSKFLGMVVTAITKFIGNNIEQMQNTLFILRRVYEFCASYNKFQENRKVPDSPDFNEDELNKIIEDERELEVKLICHLMTFTLSVCAKSQRSRFDFKYFCLLTDSKTEDDEIDNEFSEICSKYYLISILYDIDLVKEFGGYLKETRSIYETAMDKINESDREDKDKISQFIYELSYTFSLQKTFNEKTLNMNPYGIVILSGIYFTEEKKHLIPEITVQDALYLYLRCSTTSLYCELYHNKAVESVARYWLWVAITQTSTNKLKSELKEMPTLIVTIFLQMLLVKNCTETDDSVRNVTFTLLSRVLCLVPEQVAFDFTLDTLLMCPYMAARCQILSILKNMMLKTIKMDNAALVRDIENKVNSIELQDKKVLAPPALPPRSYILINQDRMAALHSLALLSLNEASKSSTKLSLTLLLSYMNFFVSLREKWDNTLLQIIHDEVANRYNESTEETLPEIGFIKLTNDTLEKYLA